MLDWHPHLPIMAASIHPCRHGQVRGHCGVGAGLFSRFCLDFFFLIKDMFAFSQVMKKLVDQLAEGGSSAANSVERYLFVFLKFIASIVPTSAPRENASFFL